jgi:ribosomal protein L18
MGIFFKRLFDHQVRGFAKRVRNWEAPPQRVVLTLTSKHVKAQVVNWRKGTVDVEASTLQKAIRQGTATELKSDAASETAAASSPLAELAGYQTASVEAARRVGTVLGRRARTAGVNLVQWQRPGRFHGKIRAFYEAFQSSGIKVIQR